MASDIQTPRSRPLQAGGATMIDLAWAAGVFEGEGYIGHNKIAPRCGLAMTDEDVVRRLHAIMGIGSVHRADRSRRGHKPIWAWGVGGFPSTQYVLALFWPWLGQRRRLRAKEILTEFATRPAQRAILCKRGHDLNDPEIAYTKHLPRGRIHRTCRVCVRINWATRMKAKNPEVVTAT